MAISEPARSDLYNRLTEVLGQGPADTLMAALPTYDPAEILTRADLQLHLAPIQSDLKELKEELRDFKNEVSRRFETVDMRFEAIHHRMFQLLMSLVAGVFVIVAAMVGIAIWG